MLLSESVTIRWAPNVKKHYESKGYVWTKQGDEFEVKVSDLLDGSNVKVKVRCDYCNTVFYKTYSKFLKQRRTKGRGKDCCQHCINKAISEACMEKYGVDNPQKVKEIAMKGRDRVRISQDQVARDFAVRGYILLDTYKNVHIKVRYICPKHGVKEITYCNLRSGAGCRDCDIERRRGENSMFWQGGVSSLRSRLWKELKDWKKESFNACDYKCAICGKTYNDMQVHHVRNFAAILRETLEDLDLPVYPELNAYKKEELDSIIHLFREKHTQLGVVLCKEHHKLFHKKYGRSNNTAEQFAHFKQEMSQELGITA